MEKISARFILEILGRPKDHVSESLKMVVDKIGSDKDINITEKKLHDPVSVEKTKDLFTTFAEVEAEFSTVESYFNLLFAYMPSNVEIFHPEKFKTTSGDLNHMSNLLVKRLHEYDAIVKKVMTDKDILAKQLNDLKGNSPQIPNSSQPDSKAEKTKPKKSKKKKG